MGQIFHSKLLKQWIKPNYLDQSFIESLQGKFCQRLPFPHLELPSFFLESKIKELRQALGQEQFLLKESDLFKFRQTADFKILKHNKVLQQFRAFLSGHEFIQFLSNITSQDLQENKIDMFGTLYQDTNFLLCHDDQLEGRKIAYFLYLSDMDQEDGGSLNLFARKNGVPDTVNVQILPTYNTFACFLVSEKSFHEVAEVVTDTARITITGWFYD